MSPRTVLVVDDSGFARRTVRRTLEDGGLTVIEAHCGADALAIYTSGKPDVVLLDVSLGEMDGLAVLQSLRTIDRNATVIMVTADVQNATKQDALTAGAVGFVNKPFQPRDLLAEVQRWMPRTP